MRISVLRNTGTVSIDNVSYTDIDMSSIPDNIHAIQWYGSSGEIEYKATVTALGIPVMPKNSTMYDTTILEEVIQLWRVRAGSSSDDIDTVATAARMRRNKLLQEADVLINILEDTGVYATELRKYRQALRDIPNQEGFPLEISWPTLPE